MLKRCYGSKACRYEWVQCDCYGHATAVLRGCYVNLTGLLPGRYRNATGVVLRECYKQAIYGGVMEVPREGYGSDVGILTGMLIARRLLQEWYGSPLG